MTPGELLKLRINGLHYAAVVRGAGGQAVTAMLHHPSGEPVREVWDYLEYVRESKTGSPNSLKRFCYDLMHFCDYLLLAGKRLEFITPEVVAGFISYLIVVDPKPDRDSRLQLLGLDFGLDKTHAGIERSMWRRVPVLPAYSASERVIAIRPGIGLQQESIARIANRAKLYVQWLKEKSPYRQRFSHLDLDNLFATEVRSYAFTAGRGRTEREALSVGGYLSAKGIRVEPYEVKPLPDERNADDGDMSALKDAAGNRPRDLFLLVLLEAAGLRIGEALGLRLTTSPKRQPGRGVAGWTIAGDIEYSEGQWTVHVVPRPGNPPDRRVKNNKGRPIVISARDQSEFENTLDRYLHWRVQVMKTHGAAEHGWLIVNRVGAMHTYNAAKNRFGRLKGAAGLAHRKALTHHSLRHRFVSRDLNAGVSPFVKSKEAGHADTDFTVKRYGHLDRRRLAQKKAEAAKYLQGDET